MPAILFTLYLLKQWGKKILLHTSCMLLLLHIAQAQTSSLGVRIGVADTWLLLRDEVGNTDEFDHMGAFQAAFVYELKLGRRFAIQPELMYGQHGGRFDVTDYDLPITKQASGYFQVNNIEFPILIKTGITKGGWDIQIAGGPSFGFTLPSTSQITVKVLVPGQPSAEKQQELKSVCLPEYYGNSAVIGEYDLPTTSRNKSLHFALSLGWKAKRLRWFAELRYMHGLKDLFPEQYASAYHINEYSRRVAFQVGAMAKL